MQTAVSYKPDTTFHLHVVKSHDIDIRPALYETELMEIVQQFKSAVFACIESEHSLREHKPEI
jgi:hypothetical protein